ncbi:MAG: fimbria/pilus outer membrane usher protein [Thermodesulfobacteriota bacterium]
MPSAFKIIYARPNHKVLALAYMERVRKQILRFVLSAATPRGSCSLPFTEKVQAVAHCPPVFIPFLCVILIPFSMLFLSPLPVSAQETIIPVVYLNEEQKGEFFIKMSEDGDFWIKEDDLKEIGLLDPKGKIVEMDRSPYLSLNSIPGLQVHFDHNRQTLKIQAPPEMLAGTVLDLSARKQKNVQKPKENSLFFNYGLNYNAVKGFKFDSFGLTGQLGVRIGNFLILTDSVVQVGERETRFNRLLSNVTYDRRERMDRFVIGDSYAASGHLGSGLVLGGLSYSKNYSADPNVIKRPVQGYQGYVTTPSEVSVYLNGIRIGSEKVSPGGFDIRNIMAYGGRQDLEIVIKDAFGREQRITNPFYVSDSLLGKGFHDYSYHIGFRRENIGNEGDRYKDPVFIGYHRYGLTNNLTVGVRGEGGGGLYNIGSSVSFAGRFGALDLALAGSRDQKEKTGTAYSANYTFQGNRFNGRIGITRYSEDFSTLSQINSETLSSSSRPKYEFGTGIGFGTKKFGSLAVNYTKASNYSNEDKDQWGLMYSKGIGQRFNVTLSLYQTKETGPETDKNDLELFICLTYYPWKETIMTNTGISGDSFRGTLQLQKNAPPGEGFGYRASLGVRDEKEGFITNLTPYVQYNGRFGVYSALISTQFGGAENLQTYQFNASGAIVYVGNTFGFSRPVDDSFALVKVGKVPGVRVYHNNQEIGKTDRTGKMVLPIFNSYDANQVRINDKDIPMHFALKDVSRFISPGYRSGTLINFEANKVQAYTGMLKAVKDGKKIPIEYITITMKMNGKTLSFQTGRDGEFFVEDATPGTYKAQFKYAGKALFIDLTIPKSDEIIIDGGEIDVPLD